MPTTTGRALATRADPRPPEAARPGAALAGWRPRPWLALLALVLAACSTPPELPQLPETSAVRTPGALVKAQRHMIATGHPLASEAGLQILRAGGSAVDAAVAAQMVLTLVEPQSSGVGGGALLLHWDGRETQAWDGRETAPAAADERLLLGPDGRPQPLAAVAVGGRAVGVPGAVRMLDAAHRRHGRLPWARLLEPAIALAEQGFPVSQRLHTQLAADQALRRDPQALAYFYGADQQPHPVGHVLRNPALAQILRQIGAQGSRALHEGPLAADLVARVRGHAGNPGRMTEADLAAYEPRLRAPLCTMWQQRWWICGFPPPSSGHLALMQMLGLMDQLPPVREPLAQGLPTPDWLHAYTEAARLAYADRAQFVADPDFVAPPAGRWSSLLEPPYLKERAALIGPQSMRRAAPGQPRAEALSHAPQADTAEAGTSHISVVDGRGQAVSMTTTIEGVFGARLMADGGTGLPGGYLLNHQLTDFSAEPMDARGWPIANRLQPGKRPRSSMSPTLVFDARDGRLLMSLGSPLGQVIPHLVAKALIGSLQWNLDPQQAIALPNFGSFNGPTVLEKGRFPPETRQALLARGHELQEIDIASGLQLIRRSAQGWEGASDPRREGWVSGD
ncbi:MAG: gamma-glutamyltransferase family protein [Rubrivivax sp.]|nr:gamma-glutamyltransferase family protein [Rubrivivax sp.]